jgi:hypothetical protein
VGNPELLKRIELAKESLPPKSEKADKGDKEEENH